MINPEILEIIAAIVLFLTVIGCLYLQELSTLGTAWLLGYRDIRFKMLYRESFSRSYSFIGWILVPAVLGILLFFNIAVPQWGFSKNLIHQIPSAKNEKKDWRLIQLSPILVFFGLGWIFLMIASLVSGNLIVATIIGTIAKQLIYFALLQFIPVPPFALGRAFPKLFGERDILRAMQFILITLMLLDGFLGWGLVGFSIGLVADLFIANVLVLS